MLQEVVEVMIKFVKERIAGFVGSASGLASVLGSWQVCHNICLGLIALLAFFGIAATGMPLLFLTKVAIPFWIAAFILLFITLGFYFKKRCISKQMILFNTGLVVIGIPFFQSFTKVFWGTGLAFIFIAGYIFIQGRYVNHEK